MGLLVIYCYQNNMNATVGNGCERFFNVMVYIYSKNDYW